MAISIDKPLRTLADLLPGLCEPAAGALALSGLCLDSRRCASGEVFCAVRGLQGDGRCHIPEAVARGCVAVIAEESESDIALDGMYIPVPVVKVSQLDRQLSAIAGRFYGNPGNALRLTAITGTNGKTSCSFLLGQLLDVLGEKAGVIGTLGYGMVGVGIGESTLVTTGMTTPDAIEVQRILADLVDQEAVVATMEVSSHSLDQFRVAAVFFDTAIFTNLSRDHLDYHGSEEAYGAAKARLFTWPGLNRAVINADDAFGRLLLAGLPAGVEALAYGQGDSATVRASKVLYDKQGIRAQLDTPWGQGILVSPLLGEFNLYNLLAVVAAACAQGHPLPRVLEAMPVLNPVPGRMEIVALEGGDHPQVVVDYAHTPDALEKALLALRQHCAGELWCLFGCGGDRDTGKRPLMGGIAARLADRVVVTSDNPRSEQPGVIIDQILDGLVAEEAYARGHVTVEPDRRTAIVETVLAARSGDTVLIAGKGHEAYQQVGNECLPFSDRAEARLALRRRDMSVRGGVEQ